MTSTEALAALTDALDWIEHAPDDASHVLAHVAKAREALATLAAERARAEAEREEHCCNDPSHMSAEYLAALDEMSLMEVSVVKTDAAPGGMDDYGAWGLGKPSDD